MALVAYEVERLAAKSSYASDILQNILAEAKNLQELNRKLTRYICQFQLLLTWRRGTAALKMAGSAAKTIASLMVLAAPLHPKLRVALGIGHKLWRLGAGLKIINIFANIMRDIWENGCRKVVEQFVTTAASLTSKFEIFGPVMKELQKIVRTDCSLNGNPQQLFDNMKHFIPKELHACTKHICCMIFGGERYSPIFDFVALISNPVSNDPSIQLIRELESFNFTKFTQCEDSKALQAVSSLLHISRELIDFFDGFHKFTDKDCTFLHGCLVKFTQESVTILKVATLLESLSEDSTRRDPFKSDKPASVTVTNTNSNAIPQILKESEPMETETVPNFTKDSPEQHMFTDHPAKETTVTSVHSLSTETNSDSSEISSDIINLRSPNKHHDNSRITNLAQSFLSLSDLIKRGTFALASFPRRQSSGVCVSKEMSTSFPDSNSAIEKIENKDIEGNQISLRRRIMLDESEPMETEQHVFTDHSAIETTVSSISSLSMETDLDSSEINSDIANLGSHDKHQDNSKIKNLAQSFLSLSDLMKRGTYALASFPRRQSSDVCLSKEMNQSFSDASNIIDNVENNEIGENIEGNQSSSKTQSLMHSFLSMPNLMLRGGSALLSVRRGQISDSLQSIKSNQMSDINKIIEKN